MNRTRNFFRSRRRSFAALILLLSVFGVVAGRSHLSAQDKSGFPDGFDAVQVTEGKWRVTWMEPEPMHSIETAETADSALTLPKRPPTVRVEFKVHP